MPNELLLPPDTMIWDRSASTEPVDILYSFALEELLCRSVGQGNAPLVHIWRHSRAFVMGLRDSRLPQAPAADLWLRSQGYDTAVRNSGGAAVPLDLGVVNISLLLPKTAGDMEHRKDFELMVDLLRKVMSSLSKTIDQGEVIGSFCPGEFDLSVGGKKFCGIAQRRQQRAISVQAFVIVEGKGEEKAAVAREFYNRAAGDAAAGEYPLVEPGSMASLEECLGIPLTSEQFVQKVAEVLESQGLPAITEDEKAKAPDEGLVMDMVELLKNRYGISGKAGTDTNTDC